MRIFDVYEHPSFEVEEADKAVAPTILRRLGVGVTVSAIAAIGFWGYHRSDSSSSQPGLSATWLTETWGTHHYLLRKGGF